MYIIDVKSNKDTASDDIISSIEERLACGEIVTEEELKIILDNLCFQVRSKFTSEIDTFNFLYKCDVSQAMITYYLEKLNIKVNPCMTQNVITDSIIGHSFVTFSYNGKDYLVDPTYRQFLMNEMCDVDKYIIHSSGMTLKTPDPGFYIPSDKYPMLKEFDYFGYHELTEEFARMYGDSFYNTKTGIYNLNKKTMSGNIYINSFMKGHEKLSKTFEELDSLDMVVLPINERRTL